MLQINKNDFLSQLIYRIILLIQIGIFLYLFRSSLFFSNNFEQTQMRLIDDYAMQFSIFNYQESILHLDLPHIFFMYDYAYGWLFWFVFGLLTIPFHMVFKLLENEFSEQMFIISVRCVNIFLLFILLLLIGKILRKILFDKSELKKRIALILTTSITLTPTFGYWVGRPMPPILAAMFLISGVYLGIKKPKINMRELACVYAAFGCAVGIKLNYSLYVPLCMLLILEIRRFVYGEEKIEFGVNRRTFKSMVVFFAGVVFSSSPALFIRPDQGFPRLFETFNIFRSLSVSKQVEGTTQFIDNFSDGIIFSGFGLIPHFVLFVLASSLILQKIFRRGKSKHSNFVLIIILYVVFCEVFLAYLLGLGTKWIQSYSLPLIAFLPICLLIVLRPYNPDNRRILGIVSVFFLFISLNFIYTLKFKDSNFPTIYSYQSTDKQAREDGVYEVQRSMQSKIELREQDIDIFQDFTLPTAWSGFREHVTLTYVYEDWEKKALSGRSSDFYLFVDKQSRNIKDLNWSENTALTPSEKALRNLFRSGNLLEGTCKLSSNEARYFFFSCVASK